MFENVRVCCLIFFSYVSLITAETCKSSFDCTLFADCNFFGFCSCKSEYDSSYTNDRLYCNYRSETNVPAIVVPIFVVTFIIAFIVFFLCRRRRLAQAAQSTVWIQPAQPTIGVTVSSQTQPSVYPSQQYHAAPPAFPTQQYHAAPPPPYTNQGCSNPGYGVQ